MYDRFKDPKHKAWAKAVKKRDGYKCVICGRGDVYLHSHHLNSFDKFVEDRFNVNNGITLCAQDHDLFHSIMKKGNNTKYQFQEFKQMIELLKLIAKKQVLKK